MLDSSWYAPMNCTRYLRSKRLLVAQPSQAEYVLMLHCVGLVKKNKTKQKKTLLQQSNLSFSFSKCNKYLVYFSPKFLWCGDAEHRRLIFRKHKDVNLIWCGRENYLSCSPAPCCCVHPGPIIPLTGWMRLPLKKYISPSFSYSFLKSGLELMCPGP